MKVTRFHCLYLVTVFHTREELIKMTLFCLVFSFYLNRVYFFLIYKLLNNCNDINNCLNIDFHLASDTHNYLTRYSQAKSLSVPFAKLDYYKRSLNVPGAKIVNSLSYDLFKLSNISLFKTQSKFIFKSK